MDCSEWCAPPSDLVLAIDVVHIWQAMLDQPSDVMERLERSLSADERAKINRFRFAHHQRWAIASRGILRQLLGQYLNLAPQQIQFIYGFYGKPTLSPGIGSVDLQFNLSHSEAMAVYAIAHYPVGIDLEHQRSVSHLEQIAQRYFSSTEQMVIRTCPSEEQPLAFLQHWVSKEATLKAIGAGIAQLEQVEVSLEQNQVQLKQGTTSRTWHLRRFVPQPEYIAALAVDRPDLQFCYFQWEMIR